MNEVGINAYGVDQEQAKLETDKILSHNMMVECGIPCPEGVAAENYDDAQAFLANPPWEFVIKAAGPCGGKGVELPNDIEEAKRIVDEFMLGKKNMGKQASAYFFKRENMGPRHHSSHS
jgi:phosphoribosylamine-glycine ligase